MNQISSYVSLMNLGHWKLYNLFEGPVVVQEKLDGSQISFGKFGGKVYIRSRRQPIIIGENKMFRKAEDTILALFEKNRLPEKFTFRGEYLSKPKHNKIQYEREPQGNIVLFDVQHPNGRYFAQETTHEFADLLEIDYAPVYAVLVSPPELDFFNSFLETDSILGGTIEGVVLKNYTQEFAGKPLMGKYVSAAFEESMKQGKIKVGNSFIEDIVAPFRTDARWDKAIQHLREEDKLENSMKDIPALLKEITIDVLDEHEEQIKNLLFKRQWKNISKGLTQGFPQYYKDLLVKEQLGE